MRYLLIDKVIELDVGNRVTGIKNVTLSEDFFQDHFPGFPVMPGALIIEAAAQLSGFLLEVGQNPHRGDEVRRAVLIQVDHAKFRDRAGPGDQLLITASVTSRLEAAAQVFAEVAISDRRIADMELTFSLRLVDHEEVHEQRRRLYELWTRDLELSKPIV